MLNFDSIHYTLSGGEANVNPENSIGGQASQENQGIVSSQNFTYTAGQTITGITLLASNGNAIGIGTLSYVRSTNNLLWIDDDGASYSIMLNGDNTYKIGGKEHLIFSLVSSQLPLSDESDDIDIQQRLHNFLRPVSHYERTVGIVIYRCGYFYNPFNSPAKDVNLSISQPNFGSALLATEYQDLTFNMLSSYDVQKLLVPNRQGTLLIEAGFQTRTDLMDYYKSGKPFVGARHERPMGQQVSDGVLTDLATLLTNEYDPDNILSQLTWSTSLEWDEIPSHRYVSFWLQYDLPPGSNGPEIIENSTLSVSFRR